MTLRSRHSAVVVIQGVAKSNISLGEKVDKSRLKIWPKSHLKSYQISLMSSETPFSPATATLAHTAQHGAEVTIQGDPEKSHKVWAKKSIRVV